jgi:hypothetical protein
MAHPVVTTPDDWSPVHRARLEAVVAAAVRDALATLPDGVGTFADAARKPAETAAAPLAEPGTYLIPSYAEEGAESPVPIDVVTFDPVEMIGGERGAILTAFEDRVVREPLDVRLAFRAPGNRYVYAGGAPYVEAGHPARAMEWGRYLFGGSGFVVWSRADREGTRFVVAGIEPGSLEAAGRLERAGSRPVGGGLALRPPLPGELFLPGEGGPARNDPLRAIALVTADDLAIVRGAGGPARVPGAGVERPVAIVEEAVVDPLEAQYVAAALTHPMRSGSFDPRLVELVVDWDRAIFAVLPWERRAALLQLLIRSEHSRRREAIIEIVRGTEVRSELDAVFAAIRGGGVYPLLFETLDGQVFALLQELGRRAPQRAGVDWEYLAGLFLELGLPLDPERSVGRALAGARMWITGTIEGFAFLFTRPDQVVAGVAQLGRLLWTLDLAAHGDRESQAAIDRMVSSAAQAIADAIAGMHDAESLGVSATVRFKGAAISGDILERLRWAVVLEIASWFVGVGEIKTLLRASGISEALANLLARLARLGRLAKVAEAAEAAARVERILVALARAADVAGEPAALARLAEALPEGELAKLAKLAESVELPDGATAAALMDLIKGDAELTRAAGELRDALALMQRVEAKAAQVGGLTSTMTAGLERLLEALPASRRALLDVIDSLPATGLEPFLRAMRTAKPGHLVEWGTEGLRALATRPRALAALEQTGSDVLQALLKREGGSWQKVDGLIGGLERKRLELADPANYQRFLDRLVNGDAAAHAELTAAASAQRRAERAVSGLDRLAKGGRTQLLEDLAEFPATTREALAAIVDGLTEKELDGLERYARLGQQGKGRLDWTTDLLGLAPADRRQFLELLADVAAKVPESANEGLESVVRAIYNRTVRTAGQTEFAVQGSLGELYAARTLIDDYKATRLAFQQLEPHRTVDIVADLPGVTAKVEVKTNLAGEASFVEREVLQDLVNHASTGYDDLIYLYHWSVKGELPGIGQRMLGLFDTAELQSRFAARGLDIAKARKAFEAWLSDPTKLTTFKP